MTEPTPYLSVHKTRRAARRRENELQAWLNDLAKRPDDERYTALGLRGLPRWTRGVTVQKAGWRQYLVVASGLQGV